MKTTRNTRVILYGGAFNPPTLAHVAILEACIKQARQWKAEVWLMPSGERRDKTIGVSRERRLEYIAAMTADARRRGVRVSIITTELDRTEPVETYDTVKELEQNYPDRSFTWVFGADSTETMGEWKQGRWLLERLDKLVIEREGSTVNPQARRTTLLPVVTPVVSSTEVRRRLAVGAPVRELVSPSVAELLASVS